MNNNQSATLNYQERDHEIVDYQFYELPQAPGVQFRGPKIDLDNQHGYFTCIGAAQTVGIYIEKPYPSILAEEINLPALNLAVGASWPGFYSNKHPELLELVNQGQFLILQVMSARGESSSRFEATDTVEMMRNRSTGETITSVHAFEKILAEEPDYIDKYVDELRTNWIKSNLDLINKITVPIILFWYSRRKQEDQADYFSDEVTFKKMGEFPQFVDPNSINVVRDKCTGYAECLSTRNTGHPLVSRFTGKPVHVDHSSMTNIKAIQGKQHNFLAASTNDYYPSPEMHQDAAGVLASEIRKLKLV